MKIILVLIMQSIMTIASGDVARYDPLGRMVEVRASGNTVLLYSYDGSGNLTSMSVLPALNSGPLLRSGFALVGRVGIPFNQVLVSSATPAAFATSALPSGLSLKSSSGQISGTPTVEGIYLVAVTISAGGKSKVENVSIQIRAATDAPILRASPESQAVVFGSMVTLSAEIDGSGPLTFQWKRGAEILTGSTTPSLVIPTFSSEDEGAYTLIATNPAGSVTTIPANLLMSQPLAINGEASGLPIDFEGAAPWSPQTEVTYNGYPALQSGAITHNQQSVVKTTINGPGVLSFRWKVSSEAEFDGALFNLDGSIVASVPSISGELDWSTVQLPISAGSHVAAWGYVKDGNTTTGADKAWLADVRFVNGFTLSSARTGKGQVVAYPELAAYPSGISVSLNAVPDPGWYFAGWSGDVSGDSGKSSVTMSTDRSVFAEFKEDLGPSVDASELAWTTTGDSDWFGQPFVVVKGSGAARSGAIGNNQSSSIATTVQGGGMLTFKWKVSSESGYDYLRLFLDNQELAAVSGEVNWENNQFVIPSGQHTLRWTYTKDQGIVEGDDAGWLDAVTFVPNGVKSFSDWSQFWNLGDGENGVDDDPNEDGIPNLLAYALGFSPHLPAQNFLPVLTVEEGFLTLTYRKSKTAIGVSYLPERSEGLDIWTTSSVTKKKIGESPDWEIWKASTPASSSKQFLRLRVFSR